VSIVLDSSVTLAWVYADERSQAVLDVQETVARSGAWVPRLWHLEVANSLQQSVRRGRLGRAERDEWLADFAILDIRPDPDTEAHAWSTTLNLAERFTLTLYDAAYLDLAHRRGLPIASLDRELRAAGRELGIPLLGV
jgi:predicted nucleic acid-binding protein